MGDEPFLAAIDAAPGDDAFKLVYADHLDETGRPERAARIRLRVEVARGRLAVHHVNGDRADHRPENLAFVDPRANR